MNDFDAVIENQDIKRYIKKSLETGRVSHTYIIEGEKGSGKKLITWTFARLLQCEDKENRGCGKCTSCIQNKNMNHPDVIWIRPEKAAGYKVEEIRRQLINTLEVRPLRSPYKIYIIDQAQTLNAQSQNAILKSLEEPPEYAVIFLLTANTGMLLDTIISRSIWLKMKPVSDQGMKRILEKREIYAGDELGFILNYATGNPGKAIELVTSETFRDIRGKVISLLKEIDVTPVFELGIWAGQMKDYKDEIHYFFDIISMWYRDVLVLKAAKEKKRIVFFREIVYLQKQCGILSFESINHIFKMIEGTRDKIRANVNFEASIELLLIMIRREYTKG